MRKTLLAVITGMTLLVAPAAPVYASGLLPPTEPANTPTPVFFACHGTPGQQATSAACTSEVLAAIDHQHAAEGIGPLVLPADFDTEPIAQQIMQIVGAERASRGLSTPMGLVASYDTVAQGGADSYGDPPSPAGTTSGDIWAGGMYTPLEADFDWMYNDGPGGDNRGCQPVDMSGCWVHRDIILDAYFQQTPAGFYVGAAYAPSTYGGGSYAALLAVPPAAQPIAAAYEEPGDHQFIPLPVRATSASARARHEVRNAPARPRLGTAWYRSRPFRAGFVIASMIAIAAAVSIAGRRRVRRRPQPLRRPTVRPAEGTGAGD